MPTKFPDLPTLPDPSAPLKKLVEALQSTTKQAEALGKVKDELIASAEEVHNVVKQAVKSRLRQ